MQLVDGRPEISEGRLEKEIRVYDFLDSLKDKEQKDESVLIVSHGGVFAPVSSYSGRSRKEDNLIDNLLANAQAYTFEL